MGQSWAYEGRRERPTYPWRGGRGECCGQCGEQPGRCRCHECRTEAKSLLAEDNGLVEKYQALAGDIGALTEATAGLDTAIGDATQVLKGARTAFIGGDCCVSLSVEVAADTPSSGFAVAVAVRDSEGDRLTWSKVEPAGTRYKVHEYVITTRPGAKLSVVASNCTARVRWCECFNC